MVVQSLPAPLPRHAVPRPGSWQDFELMIRDACSTAWNIRFEIFGRSRQEQTGIDVYGTDSSGNGVAIQCKAYKAAPSRQAIEKELGKADLARLPICEYFLATTASRCARLIEDVVEINILRRRDGKLPVKLLFWEDVEDLLRVAPTVHLAHYPMFWAYVSTFQFNSHLRDALFLGYYAGSLAQRFNVHVQFAGSFGRVAEIAEHGCRVAIERLARGIALFGGGIRPCMESCLGELLSLLPSIGGELDPQLDRARQLSLYLANLTGQVAEWFDPGTHAFYAAGRKAAWLPSMSPIPNQEHLGRCDLLTTLQHCSPLAGMHLEATAIKAGGMFPINRNDTATMFWADEVVCTFAEMLVVGGHHPQPARSVAITGDHVFGMLGSVHSGHRTSGRQPLIV